MLVHVLRRQWEPTSAHVPHIAILSVLSQQKEGYALYENVFYYYVYKVRFLFLFFLAWKFPLMPPDPSTRSDIFQERHGYRLNTEKGPSPSWWHGEASSGAGALARIYGPGLRLLPLSLSSSSSSSTMASSSSSSLQPPDTPIMLYIGAGLDLSPLLTFAPGGPPYPLSTATRSIEQPYTYTSFIFVDAKPRHTFAYMVPDFNEWKTEEGRTRSVLSPPSPCQP